MTFENNELNIGFDKSLIIHSTESKKFNLFCENKILSPNY